MTLLAATGSSHLTRPSMAATSRAWVKDDANYARIMGLITLAIPAGPGQLRRLTQSAIVYGRRTAIGIHALLRMYYCRNLGSLRANVADDSRKHL